MTYAAYAKRVPVIGRKPKPMTADYDKVVVNNVIDLREEDGHLFYGRRGFVEFYARPASRRRRDRSHEEIA